VRGYTASLPSPGCPDAFIASPPFNGRVKNNVSVLFFFPQQHCQTLDLVRTLEKLPLLVRA